MTGFPCPRCGGYGPGTGYGYVCDLCKAVTTDDGEVDLSVLEEIARHVDDAHPGQMGPKLHKIKELLEDDRPDVFFEVVKIADVEEYPENPMHDLGVYPGGELMTVERTYEDAVEFKQRLEDIGPSDRFGETMDDAPYKFIIEERRID